MSEEILGTGVEEVVKPAAIGKTYSEDYVHTVREEAKENRIARKAAEAEATAIKLKFKTFVGLKDTDDLNDDVLAKYQTNHQNQIDAAFTKANERLIKAEIKSIDGYDSKLIERLLDKSKLTISEDGTVEGLKEAVEALETEFPQIKTSTQSAKGGAANPPAGATKTEQEEYDELMKQAQKNPGDSFLRNKVFLAKEKLRKK